jgi:SPP1 gp7 family putative phage head morphogenesis protein
MAYWDNRLAAAQDRISQKTAKQIAAKMRKYYKTLAQSTIDDFEATYNKLLATVTAGQQPTPADLYKLDKYWKMQSVLEQRLKSMNARNYKLMFSMFKLNYQGVYESLNIPDIELFSTMDEHAIEQVINQIWCADGKSWSQRLWENSAYLKQTLEEGLIQCVATGKSPEYLKQMLMERFNVSYNRADVLARTELAHIQTQAAQQRYRDYGIQQVELLVEPDARTCPICEKLSGKRYSINDKMPVPLHPRCRCCMVPVVDDIKPVVLSEAEKIARQARKLDKKERLKAGQTYKYTPPN